MIAAVVIGPRKWFIWIRDDCLWTLNSDPSCLLICCVVLVSCSQHPHQRPIFSRSFRIRSGGIDNEDKWYDLCRTHDSSQIEKFASNVCRRRFSTIILFECYLECALMQVHFLPMMRMLAKWASPKHEEANLALPASSM